MAERAYRPWHPVQVRPNNDMPRDDREIRKADCAAIQAVSKGIATSEQQLRAMAAIQHICGVNDLEFLPEEHGGARDSAFKSGKRHIGLQLRKLCTFPLDLLTGEKHDDGKQRHDRRTGRPADERNADRAKQ